MGDPSSRRPPTHATPGAVPALRIGVSGWDYPDWHGPLYPEKTPRTFRALPTLARFLDFMEVNVSYYRILPPGPTLRWLEETPPTFTFAFKAWKGWTHDGEPAAGESVDRFRALVAPTAEAGRLEGVLAQLPPWVDDAAAVFDVLLPLRDALAPHRIFAEFRHRSLWRDAVFRGLEREEISFVNVDLPAVGTLPALSRVNTGPVAYVRLHGRNGAGWARGAARDTRYDHAYDAEEIGEIAEVVDELLTRCPRVLVGANNHYRAKAVAGIALLADALGREPLAVPERLRAAHPEVARCTRTLPEEGTDPSPGGEDAVRRSPTLFDTTTERPSRGAADRT